MRKLLLLSFCCIASYTNAQSLQQKLQTAYHRLEQDSQSRYASISFTVLDAKTGDLIIKGSGDPTLGSWRYASTKESNVLTTWVDAIRKAGIKKINGHIVGVDSLFGTQTIPDGWIWQDMGTYYGAGTSGLCWHEN